MSTKTLLDRTEVWNSMEAIIAKADSENRSMNAEEISKYDELDTKRKTLDEQLEREKRHSELASKNKTAVEKRVVSGELETATVNKGKSNVLASPEYRSAFLDYVKNGNETEIRSLYEGSVAEGGYAVPVSLDKVLVTTLLAENVVRAVGGRVMPTKNTVDLPVLAASATVGYAGEYPTGSNPIPASDPTFNQCILKAYKIAGLIQVSNELLFDTGIDLEGYLGQELATVVANQEEVMFITGSGGTLQSTGLFNITNVAGATVGTTNISGSLYTGNNATGSLILDGVLNAYYSMKPQNRKQAVLICGDALLSLMRKSKDQYGRYLWDDEVVNDAPPTFNGMPVLVSSAAPTTWTVGSCMGIILDKRYLVIGDRGATTFQRDTSRFFDQDQVAFRITKRSDIQVTKADAIKQIIGQ